jgi:hypothetical protein
VTAAPEEPIAATEEPIAATEEPIAVTDTASPAEPAQPAPIEASVPQVPTVEPLPEAVAFQLTAVETVEASAPLVSTVESEIVAEGASLSAIPAPLVLPEGMVMVETDPGRTQVATAEAEPLSVPRRAPRPRPSENLQEEGTLVQIETRK